MLLFLYIMITILGVSSYAIGILKMLSNQYSPSIFSRVIWVLLAINSFAGVVLSHSSHASILLGGILLLGNILICIVSFFKGTSGIGKLEYICSALLIVSVIVWIVSDTPLINLTLSLVAHFIGAAPTYKRVWQNPRSEDIGFWLLFFLASVLSIFTSSTFSLKIVILPVYFALFDGSILLLALRGTAFFARFNVVGWRRGM